MRFNLPVQQSIKRSFKFVDSLKGPFGLLLKNGRKYGSSGSECFERAPQTLVVELRGIEPLTSSMPWKRSTN